MPGHESKVDFGLLRDGEVEAEDGQFLASLYIHSREATDILHIIRIQLSLPDGVRPESFDVAQRNGIVIPLRWAGCAPMMKT